MSRDPTDKKTSPSKENREQAKENNRRTRRENRGNGLIADWHSATPDLVLKAISTLTARGHAIQFSCTRDGGSLCVRIVGDGEPFNEYIRPTEDLDEYLTGLIADYG